MSQLHFYFVAPKSSSSFVANIRYIVYDCSSSIGQHCAGSIFAIRTRSSLCNSATSRSISSLILPLDFILVFYCSTMISHHNRVGTLYLLRLNLSLMIDIAFLGTYRTAVLICPLLIVGLFSFGRNTTDDCFTSLPDTTNFHLSIYHSLPLLTLYSRLYTLHSP